MFQQKLLIKAIAVTALGLVGEKMPQRAVATAAPFGDCAVCTTQCNDPGADCDEICGSRAIISQCLFQSCQGEDGNWYGIEEPC